MNRIIKPVKRVTGDITVPGDKSIAHRALMIGAIARGVTKIRGLPESDDCNYTAAAFRDMGIVIRKKGAVTSVKGMGLKGLNDPRRPISAGNSGTTMRLMAGILAGQDFESTLTGDEGLSNRPMKRIVEPLSKMGVKISARDGEYPPLIIRGGAVRPIDYTTPVPSAQVKSAILLAGLYAKGITRVAEKYKSRDHTERMLKYFGSRLKVKGLEVSVEGRKELDGRDLDIPGDISSASFFIAAAILLKGSRIRIKNVSVNPTRAGILKVLAGMGAKVRVVNKRKGFEPAGDVIAEYSETRGMTITKSIIPAIIDELPVIFVLASLSRGRTIIKGAGELRVKEADRISSMEENLKRMGAKIRVEGDDIIIEGIDKLKGAPLDSFGDHRTCMAMAVAAMAAEGESVIEGAESVSKSFPEFFSVMERLND